MKSSTMSLTNTQGPHIGVASDLNLASLGTDQCSRGPNAFGKMDLIMPGGRTLPEWNHCLPYHTLRHGCVLPRLYPKCFPPQSGIELRSNHWIPLPPVLQYVVKPDQPGNISRANRLNRLHRRHGNSLTPPTPASNQFFLDQRQVKNLRVPACRDTYVQLFKKAPPHRKCSDWKKAFRN